LTIPLPASAGGRGGDNGPGWGAVVGAGILGDMIGTATSTPPQQPIIIVVPSAAPAPPAAAAPRTVICNAPVPVTPHLCGAPLPTPLYWCAPLQHAFPVVQNCPVAFEPKALYFWCDTLRGWYPIVGETCPTQGRADGGWRKVNFPPGAIQ